MPIDSKLAEALENLERDVSFLMALHNPSSNPTNLEERVEKLEKQQPKAQPSPRQELEQLKARLLWLEGKLNEHIDKKKKVYKRYK